MSTSACPNSNSSNSRVCCSSSQDNAAAARMMQQQQQQPGMMAAPQYDEKGMPIMQQDPIRWSQSSEGEGEWRDGLFDCFSQLFPSCICSFCCPCIVLAQLNYTLQKKRGVDTKLASPYIGFVAGYIGLLILGYLIQVATGTQLALQWWFAFYCVLTIFAIGKKVLSYLLTFGDFPLLSVCLPYAHFDSEACLRL
jgi:hypothetical protein